MEAAPQSDRPLAAGVWIWLAVALFAAPILSDLLLSGPGRPFGYVAGDAFYFLTVARNVAEHGLVSFDQEHLTNGFHPLWQGVMTGLYVLGHRLGATPYAMVLASVLAGVLFIADAIRRLGRAMSAEEGALSPLFVVLPLGIVGCLVCPLWLHVGDGLPWTDLDGSLPLMGTLWSYANGMESAVALWAYAVAAGAFVCLRVERSAREAALLGASLALLTFARLDHALIALGIAGVLVLEAHAARRWLRAGVLLAAFGLPILVYMAVNLSVFGSPVPVSGVQKSTFPQPIADNAEFLLLVLRGGLGRWWLVSSYRQAQMLLPAAAALLALLWALRPARKPALRPGRTRFDLFLSGTAVGVILLAAYDYLFVWPGEQGTWYFPVSTLFVSLFAVRALGSWTAPAWRRPARAVGFALAWSALSLLVFFALHRQSDYHQRYARFFFEEAPRVRAFYAGRDARLLSFDDGIVAYATGFPTMAAGGYVLDAEGMRALNDHQLLELATLRGYNRLTSLVYMDEAVGALELRGASAPARRYVRRIFPQDPLERYRFTVEYLSQAHDFAIIRVDAFR